MTIYPFSKKNRGILCLFLLLLCNLLSFDVKAQNDDYYNDESIDTLVKVKTNNKANKALRDYSGLVLGADYQFGIGNTIYIDFSPYIGYKFYDRLSINIGIPYMYYYNFTYKETSHVVGARAFVRLRPAISGFFKNIFLQGEAEYLQCYLGYNSNSSGPTSNQSQGNRYIKESAEGFNIGLGYSSSFSKGFSATLLLLYNLNYQNSHPVYFSPLIYRLGFMYAF